MSLFSCLHLFCELKSWEELKEFLYKKGINFTIPKFWNEEFWYQTLIWYDEYEISLGSAYDNAKK